jgi:hypothetical protein
MFGAPKMSLSRKAKNVQQRRILPKKLTTGVALGLGLIGATGLLVHQLLPQLEEPRAVDEPPGSSPPPAPSARGVPRSHRPARFLAALEKSTADEIEREEPRGRAVLAAIIPQLLDEAKALEPLGLEAAGNSMEPYLRGAFATLRATNPAAVAAMKTALTDRVCKDTVPDLELMLFAHIAAEAPEATSPRALDCAFQHHGAEDVLLWKLLDAWHGSGLPASEAINAVQARAKDTRTTGRFAKARPGEGPFLTSETNGQGSTRPSMTAQERNHGTN